MLPNQQANLLAIHGLNSTSAQLARYSTVSMSLVPKLTSPKIHTQTMSTRARMAGNMCGPHELMVTTRHPMPTIGNKSGNCQVIAGA